MKTNIDYNTMNDQQKHVLSEIQETTKALKSCQSNNFYENWEYLLDEMLRLSLKAKGLGLEIN